MILEELEVVLGSDEHGFAIDGPIPSLPSSPALPENTLLDWWPDRAPGLTGFIVKTGSQWGPFGVRLQILDADPGPAPVHWEDVVELSVEIADSVYVGELVNGPVGSVSVPSGSYRMRVAAMGRTESADRADSLPDDGDDDESALEQYLLSIWPAAPEPVMVRQGSQHAKDEMSPPPPRWPAEREPGLAAAWAVVRDLRGEPGVNPLPGELSSLSVEVDVPGPPARVFNRVQHVCGWPTSNGFMGSPDPMSTGYNDATLPESDFESVGHIATTSVELAKPTRLVKRWNWVLDGAGAVASRPMLLAEDSIVTITLERFSAGEGLRTLVRLTQDGVPLVWVEHLRKLWAWHIATMASR